MDSNIKLVRIEDADQFKVGDKVVWEINGEPECNFEGKFQVYKILDKYLNKLDYGDKYMYHLLCLNEGITYNEHNWNPTYRVLEKIKATRLAKKIYPNAELEDGYLWI